MTTATALRRLALGSALLLASVSGAGADARTPLATAGSFPAPGVAGLATADAASAGPGEPATAARNCRRAREAGTRPVRRVVDRVRCKRARTAALA